MKKSYYEKIVFLIIVLSLFSFGAKPYIVDSESKNVIMNEPKTAVSANLAAWMIIAGDRSDHDKLSIIRSGCDQAYDALLNRGFTSSEIFYLDPAYAIGGNPQSPYRDADTTLANIQWAIETWAAGLVDATHGLGIYLFDHGGTGYMCIPGTDLTDTNLNTYLDNLETSTGCNRFIIVYEACHAGSFINPVSKDNRIVVTATDITHNSAVNGAWDWAAFSETFWSSITQCKTIGEAFEDAEANVHALGYGGVQFPWIDDDHDEIGHEVDMWGSLPSGGDGSDALNVWIGTGTNCPMIFILWLPLRAFINIRFIPIWAVIDTNSLMESVYARVIPPNWTPSRIVTDPESSIIGIDYLPLVELLDQDHDGNFTGFIDRNDYANYLSANGDYKINILAKTQEGAFADIESTYVTINDDGKAPTDTTPPTISIINPGADAQLSGVVDLTVEGDDDQALDKIQIFVDGVMVKEEIMPPYYPYPEVTYNLDTSQYLLGTHNITATAIDQVDNQKSTSISVNFIIEAKIPGFQITPLIIGSILGILAIYIIKIKKKVRNLLKI